MSSGDFEFVYNRQHIYKEITMADIHFVILFNGTSNDDTDPNVTNIVKMRDGLKRDDKQFIIYRDGIGNDKEWRWWLPRLFAEITGYGGSWVMRHAHQDLRKVMAQAIKEGKIKAGDTLHFSVGGFSRGAAIARHFANRLVKRITDEMQNQFKLAVNIKLDCEYLFDTVASFGLPINLWLLDKVFGIRNQEIDLGWDFSVPAGVKAHHLVAADEHRNAFSPHLVNYKEGETEEFWVAGDHSTIGGGHKPPAANEHMADEETLRYMVRRAQQNGLQFEDAFLQKYDIKNTTPHPLGTIKTPAYLELPPTQRGPRKIYVKENDKPSQRTPMLAASIIKRMQTDTQYRPKNVLALKNFNVIDEYGTVEAYSPAKTALLWQSLAPKASRSSPRLATQNKIAATSKDMAQPRKAKV